MVRRQFRHVCTTVAVVAMILKAGDAHAWPSTRIPWSTLDSVTWDCDAIHVTITPNAQPAGFVEFVLQSGPDISWWKALSFFINGRGIQHAPVQGVQQQNSFVIPF